MTKHRDVNKCRRQEKYKMAALSGKLTSGYEMANKPKITKKKERMVKKKGKRERKTTTTTLSEKKEEASNASEQRDKGWIHVIHVHAGVALIAKYCVNISFLGAVRILATSPYAK